jgi:FkbM family methyltransferase
MSRNIERLDDLHRLISRSRAAVRLTLAVRNQCRSIIKHFLHSGSEVGGSGEEWLARQVAPRCRTFVDVGANFGQWSSMFLAHAPPGVRGILFEPGGEAVAALRRDLARDGIEIVAAALSDRETDAAPFFEHVQASMSSLTGAAPGEVRATSSIRVATLDEEMERRRVAVIDVLKIDTEGHDLHVLRGAAGLLQRKAIGVIQFEYVDAWAPAGATLAAALDLLAGFGYRTFLLKREGLFDFDYARFGEFFTYTNFVAVPGDPAQVIGARPRRLL